MDIEYLSPEDVQKEIDAILTEYPLLKGFDPARYCCGGCAFNELWFEHGPEVAEAWEELDGYRFLLS